MAAESFKYPLNMFRLLKFRACDAIKRSESELEKYPFKNVAKQRR